ncbi:carboxypeptidase [Synergistales bacterium]|nr:carboxypeptidase [Synergistales bacterium]
MEDNAGFEKGAVISENCRVERSIQLNGETLRYSAEAGFLPTHAASGEKTGEIFFVAYRKLQDAQPRPLSFIFNGGPGSSSLMLHLDCLGPRTVNLGNGIDIAELPYRLTDNSDTLLSVSDLVFIDPIGTGYSKAENSVDAATTFWGTEADAKSICHFIRLYITRNKCFRAPLYVIGESYGGIRCGAMSAYLQDMGIQPAGLVMISPALNYQDLVFLIGNDRPYIHTLPTMTNAAWYHRKLPQRLLSMEQEAAYQEASAWAQGRYLHALWKGNAITEDEKRSIAEEFSLYTGLAADEILQLNLRVPSEYFAGNILREDRLFLGVYDTRCTSSGKAHVYEEDPSTFRAQLPAFSAFMTLLTEEIGLVRDDEYVFNNKDIYPKWDFSTGVPNPSNRGGGFTGSIELLSKSLRRNERVKLFVASGNYDLRCNRGASEFAVNQMDIPRSVRKKIVTKSYDGGHMFYTNPDAKTKLYRDLKSFYEGNSAENFCGD